MPLGYIFSFQCLVFSNYLGCVGNKDTADKASTGILHWESPSVISIGKNNNSINETHCFSYPISASI